MHPALLYVPGHRLSLPELSAARLDGDVIDIGDAYIPADLVESPDVRASSVAGFVQEGTAASGPTAAWIHGAGDAPPSVHHLQRARVRRVRPRPSLRVVFHDTAVDAVDLVELGGIAVVTPTRTMLDLVLALHRDAGALHWIERLAEVAPAVVHEARSTLEALERVPGTRTGREVLERLALRTW
ncbi:hypothetical protein SRABI76_00728 [Microbacterium oxydans]|uniref:AbiEi antitoxin C-terminal domain-containing protein n=1 Tax=Microbacterium oxydans TaxID=82380 RepID=A0A0F0L8N0_9MICO|nr:type IV toxin-antitoxin system AbiEi family antitoxin [Microbacterium oxydans]KJL27896.1 hypothetical protein RS83_02956 [Microbacterium oxydans]CAH0148346.1 hypothetical protein SRABI76_00728 [Microbacterium oxydans]